MANGKQQKQGFIRLFVNFLYILRKELFSINNFDNHLTIFILGMRIRKKLPPPRFLAELNAQETNFGLNREKRNKKIILSLTSFPDRINIVPKTIKTLLNQTLKPDEIVLWLGEEQFLYKENNLPRKLLDLKEYGLSIKWCRDIRSYKKLIPSLKEFPDDIIITFDDDIYYPKNTAEVLYNSYLKNPGCIHSNRIRRLQIRNGRLFSKSAAENYWIKYDDCSYLNKITGCGGVLYPPNSLSKKVFDEDIFTKLIPTQDDVWFWAMAVLNNTKIKLVSSYDIQLLTIDGSQKCGLCKINTKNGAKGGTNSGAGMNSLEAARIIVKEYPEILDIIRNDSNE